MPWDGIRLLGYVETIQLILGVTDKDLYQNPLTLWWCAWFYFKKNPKVYLENDIADEENACNITQHA